MKTISGGLYRTILLVVMIPLVILCAAGLFFCIHTYTDGINIQVENGLRNVALSVETAYEALYDGAFDINEQGYMTKGEHVLDTSLIDRLKEESKVEISLIYDGKRMLTTLTDASGNRVESAPIDKEIAQWIRKNEEPYFKTDLILSEKNYYGYVMRFKNSSDNKQSAIFVGIPQKEVKIFIDKTVSQSILLMAIYIIATIAFTIYYVHGLVGHLNKMMSFMRKVAKGKLDAKLDEGVLKRKDEIGEMGLLANDMQTEIRKLVEEDALTGLYNRRRGDQQLQTLFEDAEKNKRNVVLAIGDIDFFKKVNDNYGHDTGDVVLKTVATALEEAMQKKGFVSRWGGEEFLLAFNKEINLGQARQILEEIRIQLEDTNIEHKEHQLTVTMTFGIALSELGKNIEDLLRKADDNLYTGKANGRNQTVG